MIPAIIAAAFLLLCCLTGLTFFEFALVRRHRKKRHRTGQAPLRGLDPEGLAFSTEWLKTQPQEELRIAASDGFTLSARLLHGDPKRFVILCHGYKTHSGAMSEFARILTDYGCSVLIPDARAHGRSGGKIIGMGITDRSDLNAWITHLNDRFDSPIIALYGVSMGGAAVMNTIGGTLPCNVRCAIEDCGYTDLKKQLIHQIRSFYHLPARFTLLCAEPYCRLFGHYSLLRGTNLINALCTCRIPLLIIHGGKDTFVPVENARAAAEASGGQLSIVPDAGHTGACLKAPDLYRETIYEFLNKNMKA